MCNLTGADSARISRRTVLAGVVGGATAAAVAPGLRAAPAVAAASRPPLTAQGHRTRLVVLGTAGGPDWENADLQGIASAVAVGDMFYLVDAGEGVGRRLRQAGLGTPKGGPLVALRAVFLTHLHSDHVADLNNVLDSGLFEGLNEVEDKVPVWGPGNRGVLPPLFGEPPEPPVVASDNPTPGTREMVELIVRAFATDFNDRARDNRRPVPAQLFEGQDVPIPPQYLKDPNGNPEPRMSPVTFYEDDRVRVSVTLVQHAPIFPALAYRFDTEDGAVVFSGDTGASANLVELAQGADVLVHEVLDRTFYEERAFPEPRTPAQEGVLQHLLAAHTVIEDVGPIAEEAGVGTLVLNHFAPATNPEEAWLPAQRGFSGRLVVGRDLDQVGVGRAPS